MKRLLITSAVCLLVLGIVAKAQEKDAGASAVAGTWQCVAHGGQNGDVPFTLNLQQSGETLSGTVSSSQGDADLTTVTFKGNQLRIEIDTDQGNYILTATLSNGQLAGQWSHDSEKQGNWEGKRQASSPSSQ